MSKMNNANREDPAAMRIVGQLSKSRGYVVVGIPPGKRPLNLGESLTTFAGYSLTGCELVVRSETDRRDWNALTLLIFGTRKTARAGDRNPAKGNRYYRCEVAAAVDSTFTENKGQKSENGMYNAVSADGNV